MAKFDKQSLCRIYIFFGMTLLHAHANYICIVCAKCQKSSVKALVKVDFLMYALYIFKICKRISRSLFKCFQQLFCYFFILVTKHSLQYGFGFRISSKMSFMSIVLKTNVTLVQTLKLVIPHVLPGNPSLVIGTCILYLDAIK